MKNSKIILASLLATCFSNQNMYAANTLINIQMGNGGTYTNDGAALANVTQTWNKFSAAGTNTYNTIKNSSGATVTGLSVTENMTNRGNWSNTNFTNALDLPLMKGGLSITTGQSGYFKFKGLSSGVYDIYIYSEAQSGVQTTINISAITSVGTYGINFSNDSTPKSLTEATSANTYTGNWMKKTVVIDKSVSSDPLYNLVLNVNGTSSGSMINGIQLQYVGAVPVPEPDTVLLLGVGGVFFIGFMRSRASAGSEVHA